MLLADKPFKRLLTKIVPNEKFELYPYPNLFKSDDF